MFYLDNIKIYPEIGIHKIGNKFEGEKLLLSEQSIFLSEEIKTDLKTYFLNSFKPNESYNFFHDVSLRLNEVFEYVSQAFENKELFFKQSRNIAKHLYNQTTHPKIKSGELLVTFITNCIVNGKEVVGIALFKSENKDTFLEVEQVNDVFEIESRKGINFNKLDKGCLIFNTEKENGYILSVVDNTNKGNEAQYWMNDFLGVKPINNEYHQTNQFLSLTKQFVTKQLDEEFEISKPDKIDLLNRSVDYFKKHDQFDKEEFEAEVFNDSNLIESFRQFDKVYRNENEIELDDNFMISAPAVKKQARAFKSVLKLDKNFHIYIHGNRDMIEQGVDKDGRKFYKIYYEKET
ncbi:MAG: nucleoid-associated protein [Bacteroidales bacterium]|nr:nucleoid-associated protein [Acholeplasmataceae bacterium]MCK9449836.1 nucleoid-associated protein [Bacteroidales bacterium]